MSQKDLASLKGLLDDPSFADVLAEGPGKFASRITKYFRDNPRPGPNSDTEQATAFLERVLQCLDEGGEDDMSAFTSNHQDNKREDRESLNEIKAKAVYRLVEDIDEKRRMMFLTNQQAELIAGSTDALQKLLDVLDLPKPKLVINLLQSQGFAENLAEGPEKDMCALWKSTFAGMVHGKPPFRDSSFLSCYLASALLSLLT